MSFLSQINQSNIKAVYNQSLVTLSIKKDQTLVGLNHLWQGTIRVCAEQKTYISIKATQGWNATCFASGKIIKEISLLPGKMQANENVALTVIVTCNAIFFLVLNKTVDFLNDQIDKIIQLQPGKVKNLKNLILNDGVFAAALFVLNGLAIPKVLGYSMGKWALIVPVVCTLGRHFWKKNNDKIQKLEQRLEQQYSLIESIDTNVGEAFGKMENQSNQIVQHVIGQTQTINNLLQHTIENSNNINDIQIENNKNSKTLERYESTNDLLNNTKNFKSNNKNKLNNNNNNVDTPVVTKKKKNKKNK